MMAGRDRDRLAMPMGSAVSLHGSTQSSGVDNIPREYHRRVLKKIAQLTKVIYALNTKNDENEDFVANLRSIHENEMKCLLDDNAARLQKCETGFIREKESVDLQVCQLKQMLEDTKGERDELHAQQSLYMNEVEKKLATLKSEHTTKVQSLVKELEEVRSEQTKLLNQISELHESYSSMSSQQLNSLKLQQEEELALLKNRLEQQIQQLQKDIASSKMTHTEEIHSLNKQFQLQMEAQMNSLTSGQKDLLSKERKAWEEKEELLKEMYSKREEGLKQQLSAMSNDLRALNDNLALSEQRMRDLKACCEESVAGSGSLKELLEKSKGDAEHLRATVSTLHTELDIINEKNKQQAGELQEISGTVGKLEAVRIANEGEIKDLQSMTETLQTKLEFLEAEKEGLQTSQHSLKENQSASIKALERELDKMRREKQELHAQFAREIEAAHAQLNLRETDIVGDHLRVVQQLKHEHTKDLSDANAEKEVALKELEQQLLSQKENEVQSLQSLHKSVLSRLEEELSDKSLQLVLALEELKQLKTQLLKEEKGLGSATSQINQLRVEFNQIQSNLFASQKRGEEAALENGQLKATLESLRRQMKNLESGQVEELKKAKLNITAEIETIWKERVKQECALLRTELSRQHHQDRQSALIELASIKDSALRQAQDKWENERRDFRDKIQGLEYKIRDLQLSASSSLEEVISSSDSRVENLRKEFENEILKHKDAMRNIQKAHKDEVLSIQTKTEEERQMLITQLNDQYSKEIKDLQMTNQLAVSLLKEKMKKKSKEKLNCSAKEHQEELSSLEARLESEFKSNMEILNHEHTAQIEKLRQQMAEMVAQSQKQTIAQETTATGLLQKLESRDVELSTLRDKTNSLTVITADLKKQLTMREREIKVVKQESKSILRLREQQLDAVHQAELESINSQQRFKAQQLLTDFNKAKTLLNTKINELQRQLVEWEHRYRKRESKPEDLEAIRELRSIVREQEQRMKDLVAEKRVYQLELMNREKNYNKLFNVNPHIGLINPLQSKPRKPIIQANCETSKYASAPSLLSPSPELPSVSSYAPLIPLSHSTTVSLTTLPNNSSISTLTSSGSQLSKKAQRTQSLLESKPQKIVMLRDSPLTHKSTFRTSKKLEMSRKTSGSHSVPLETHSQATASLPQTQGMVVQ